MATIKKTTATDSDGKTYVVWRVDGQTAHGRRPKHFSAKRLGPKAKEAAESYYKELLLAEINGAKPETRARLEQTSYTFEQISRYYTDYLTTKTRASRNASYVGTLLEQWGSYQIYPECEITRSDFRAWVWAALEKPIPNAKGKKIRYSASSIKKLIRYFGAVLNWAVTEELIKVNPLTNLMDKTLTKELRRRESTEQKDKEATCTATEFWSFADSLPDWLRNPVVMMWCTGLRVSEVALLKWDMIKGNAIHFSGDQVKEAYGKTPYMESEALAMLEQIKTENIMNGVSPEYVFRGGGKTLAPIDKDAISHQFRLHADKWADKSGLEKWKKMTPHKLRASYISRKTQDEGAPVTVVSRQVGHHSTAMTDRYSKTTERELMKLSGVSERDAHSPLESVVISMIESGWELEDIQAQVRKTWLQNRAQYQQ